LVASLKKKIKVDTTARQHFKPFLSQEQIQAALKKWHFAVAGRL